MAIKDDLPAGLYVIRNLSNTDCVLDVSAGGYANGSNIQVCTNNYTPAQTWELRWNSDGSCYIVSQCNGKCADSMADDLKVNNNVNCWDYYAGRGQCWIIEKGSTTKTVGGKTLQSYRLKLQANTSYYMDCAGYPPVSSGTNVQIFTNDGGTDQEWLFDPLETIHDSGVYEIRTLTNTANCLDNCNGTTASGNRLQSFARNNTNAQKWVLVQDGSYWKIRQGGSSLLLDAGTGTITSGQPAQIWSADSSRNQGWKITTVSTAIVDGTDYPVVRIQPVKNTDVSLDVCGASTQSETAVQLYTNNNDSNAQFWVLVPTTLTDPTMPVPNIQGMARALNFTATSNFLKHNEGSCYLKGTCPQSWTTKNGNSFRLRWRTRTFGANGKWSTWGSYNAWRTPLMKQQVPNWWYTQAFNESSMNAASVKQKQYQFEMQTQGIEDYQNITSDTGTQTVTFCFYPTITLTSATLTPDGIRVAFTTDYPYSVTFDVFGLVCNDTDILAKRADCISDENNNTFDIPFDCLKQIPSENVGLIFKFNLTTDTAIKWSNLALYTTLKYGAGNTNKYPLTLKKDNVAGLQQAWYFAPSNDKLSLLTSEGKLYPLTKSDSGLWLIPKFKEPLTLIGLWESDDGSEWCARVDTVAASTVAFHGFTWGEEDGVIIWLNKDEVLTEERNISADAEEHTLLGRAHPYVSYVANQQNGNNYTKVSATANGYILPDRLEDFGTTPASVERMLEAGHCLYRSPTGRISNVAVTDASLTFERDVIQISVTYVEESL